MLFVNWGLGKKIQWNLNRNTMILFKWMCFKMLSVKCNPFYLRSFKCVKCTLGVDASIRRLTIYIESDPTHISFVANRHINTWHKEWRPCAYLVNVWPAVLASVVLVIVKTYIQYHSIVVNVIGNYSTYVLFANKNTDSIDWLKGHWPADASTGSPLRIV